MDIKALNAALAKEAVCSHAKPDGASAWEAISVDEPSGTFERRCTRCGVTNRLPIPKG